MGNSDDPNGIIPVVIAMVLFSLGVISYIISLRELRMGGGWVSGQVGHGLALSGIFVLLFAVYFKKGDKPSER